MPTQRRYRFPRERRLKRQRLLRPLFEPGREDVGQLRAGPVAMRFRIVSRGDTGVDTPIQVGFAVTRSIGDRPARNRIKRILREVFRHHHHELAGHFADRREALTIMLVYRGRRAGAASAIQTSLPDGLARLVEKLRESSPRET